jgi:hypothetical protein
LYGTAIADTSTFLYLYGTATGYHS